MTAGRVALSGALLSVLFTAPAAGEEPARPSPPTYLRDVKPILDAHCVSCHSTKNLEDAGAGGGLALESYEQLMRGSVLAPGDVKRSEIVLRLRESDPESRMPGKAPPLAEESIALIERWVREGAPRGESGEKAAKVPAPAPLPPPRYRPAHPLDLRIPTGLVIPPDCPWAPAGAPREKLELRIRIAPLPPVSAVAFGPEPAGGPPGGCLLAAGGHGTVTVWDLARGEAVREVVEVRGTVHAVRFSPDGTLLAAGGGRPGEDGSVVVLDARDFRVLHRFAGHRESVLDLAFSPDGAVLASAGFDKTARVWDLKAGVEAFALREHSDAVYGVAFLDGGKMLASAGADRSVKLTDLGQRKVIRSLAGHEKAILALAASPDGKTLITAGQEPALRYWSVAEGKTVRSQGGHAGRVEEVAWSRDGKRVASVGSDRTVRIWNGENGAAVKSISGSSEWLYSVAFDASARRVAAGAWDGTLSIWDVETGRLLGVLIQPPARDAADLDWAAATPEGHFRATEKLLAVTRLGPSGGAQEIPLGALQARLGDPLRLARALQGGPVPPPRLRAERAY